MAVRLGDTSVLAIRVGDTPVKAVRIGETLVWTRAFGIFELFDAIIEDLLALLPPWLNETLSALYHAGIVGQVMRMVIPDGLQSLLRQTSRFRHEIVLGGDDGYLEIKIADIGALDLITTVFRRFSNDGNGLAGVGIQLMDQAVSIVRRVGAVETTMFNGGIFTGGDVIRLTQEGDNHLLYRNGELLGGWNDTESTAMSGAGYRSVALVVQGVQALLGPRQFSPGLVYIDAL